METDDSRLIIRTMDENDLDFAESCTLGQGWATETREEFEAFLMFGRQGCWVGEWEGQPCGVCVAVQYGDKGFIGEMVIKPEFRGIGLGPRLFGRAVDYLLGQGCASVSLDAIARAASYYETFGFRRICRSFRFQGTISGRSDPRVRAMTPDDLAAVEELDRLAFRADRSSFLRRRFALYPELAKIAIENGRIAGFVFGRRRESLVWAGPWWVAEGAENPGALPHALALEANGLPINVGILESNLSAIALIRSLGFKEKPNAPIRMVFGPEGDAVGLYRELFGIGSGAKG